jgi:hypothetical protein
VPDPNSPFIPKPPAKVVNAAFFQLDIIVKDSKTSPNTGWVFSTLVYDKSVSGDAWARMVPLGAMWGNDPDLNSVITPNAILRENVVNPMAPLYSIETLGYGGRLSGPNDGAISENNIVDGQLVSRASISSCMSCHGTAEWPYKTSPVPALDGSANNPSDPDNPFSYIPTPGTIAFNLWFQDRAGNVPQDSGAVALDYDMNMTFKALPLWRHFTTPSPAAEAEFLTQVPKQVQRFALEPAITTQNGRRLR